MKAKSRGADLTKHAPSRSGCATLLVPERWGVAARATWQTLGVSVPPVNGENPSFICAIGRKSAAKNRRHPLLIAGNRCSGPWTPTDFDSRAPDGDGAPRGLRVCLKAARAFRWRRPHTGDSSLDCSAVLLRGRRRCAFQEQLTRRRLNAEERLNKASRCRTIGAIEGESWHLDVHTSGPEKNEGHGDGRAPRCI